MLNFAVLGPLEVESDVQPVKLGGPRHRAVLARLLIAAPRVVPVQWLIDDLWDEPPEGALGSLQTFVGALRKALEPRRPARTASRLLVTQAPGYALRPEEVDAWRFADGVREGERLLSVGQPLAAHDQLERALGRWRGPAYAEFADQSWARGEVQRLDELRSLAVERRAEAGLALGRSAAVVLDLEAQVDRQPLREDGWRLLALGLYRSGRQGDALAALRRAREVLAEQLGIDPGEPLRQLERDILDQAAHLEKPLEKQVSGDGLWRAAIRAQDPNPVGAIGRRQRLEALMGLVRALAVTGELTQARQYRAEAVRAAADFADPLLFAQVVGAFEVPAIWTANDDEELSTFLVESAERALVGIEALGEEHPSERARLLITIALERRADSGPRGMEAAREAEQLARGLNDPHLLALALNGRFLQTFGRAGLARERALIGHQIVEIAAGQPAEQALPTVAVLGHLILVQSYAALADLSAADRHARAADELAEAHGIPLIGVFTAWYRALRAALTGPAEAAQAAYAQAAAKLPGTGMPGVENGILPLALLGLDVMHGGTGKHLADMDFGPYRPWFDALTGVSPPPASPRDLLFEARTVLHALAAIRSGDQSAMRKTYAQLLPAEDEVAGAGSGMLALGPVAGYLGRLARAQGENDRAERHFAKERAVLAQLRQQTEGPATHEG
ncbi:SARP family transcriptional regulator [Kineosporia sp. NBRC 101677]|uniref:AfsR/SARP family transcriptional regulator n=1 Tax=Kineosporia sp. NBRC 101677 TaxID=3032197 RepID=UPI0024A55D4E|nr:AfsR/SARP family transcriptional regulator [Kineosporia sp. NBRC 101677]GLY19049.1 SARP family transcriptional regulator [Kineosporia sp. NBRC 101677]